MKKIIEDTISMKEDQLNQMATNLNQFYSETQKDERMDFNHYVKILIQQRPEIRNIFILENNQIIQSYPHTEFVGLDFNTLYSSYPIQIDGIKVMNPEFPLKTQNNQKIIISVPFDFFVNPVIFGADFKMALFSPRDSTQKLYEIAAKDGQVQTQGIIFSDSELQNSLIIEKKTHLFGHTLGNYYLLKYYMWDTVFEKQTSAYEQVLLGSGIILSVITPILIIRYQRLIALTSDQSAEIQRANERLRRIDRAKEEFAAMLSHELKTPLVPIQGYADILLNERLGKLNEEQKQRLQIIKDSSLSLLKLISDILDAQKLELGELKITKKECNIRTTVEKCTSSMATLASSYEVEIKSQVTKDIYATYDEERIKQVLTNLIKNGMKACKPRIGKIGVFAEDSVDDVTLAISDNGIGIPNDAKDKIFSKFYQVDTSLTREDTGSGLGLTVSKGIVETHGGKMWLESEVGKGTTFYFSIPKGERLEIKNTSALSQI